MPILVLAALALCACRAQPPGDKADPDRPRRPAPSVSGTVLIEPRWAREPSVRDLLQAHRAASFDEETDVVCAPGRRGRLANCRIQRQHPEDVDFSAALEAVADKYRLADQPLLLTGRKINRVRFRLKWPLLRINDPAWTAGPTFDEVRKAYEQRPQRGEARGFATLSCTVLKGGSLVCEPGAQGGGEGFTALALGLTGAYRVPAATPAGLPTEGGRVTLSFSFPVTVPSGQGGAIYTAPMAVLTAPDWEKTATSADLSAAYPDEAMRMGRTGKASILCVVLVTGALDQCRVTSEDPEGQGFGEAALSLADKFRMRPATRDGIPYGGAMVSIPVNFQIAD